MGLAQTPYWGIAIFEAESYEKLLAFAKDPEYIEKVVPDELEFVDRERSSLLVGKFAEIICKSIGVRIAQGSFASTCY